MRSPVALDRRVGSGMGLLKAWLRLGVGLAVLASGSSASAHPHVLPYDLDPAQEVYQYNVDLSTFFPEGTTVTNLLFEVTEPSIWQVELANPHFVTLGLFSMLDDGALIAGPASAAVAIVSPVLETSIGPTRYELVITHSAASDVNDYDVIFTYVPEPASALLQCAAFASISVLRLRVRA